MRSNVAEARPWSISTMTACSTWSSLIGYRNVRVYRNVGTGSADAPQALGNWIAVQLREDGANRDGIGSWLEVKTTGGVQQRELTIGGGHVSGELVPIHFGLGQAQQAQVRITWPDGTVGDWQTVTSNASYVIARGAAPATLVP